VLLLDTILFPCSSTRASVPCKVRWTPSFGQKIWSS